MLGAGIFALYFQLLLNVLVRRLDYCTHRYISSEKQWRLGPEELYITDLENLDDAFGQVSS